MREKPFVGQVLYSLNVGNAARGRVQCLTPVEVKSVGRKYFTAGVSGETYRDVQYHLETWWEKTEYSARSVLYTSKQEWEDEAETSRICKQLAELFRYGNCPKNMKLPMLRQIETILTAQTADRAAGGECCWTYDDNEYAPKWDSTCGEAWSFIEGGPVENRVKFCQGCGRKIHVKEP